MKLPRALWAIIAVSVALRVMAALYLGNEVVPLPGTYDQVSYDTLAERVATGHGFSFDQAWWPATRAGEPTAHWSFLYTSGLAALYRLLGQVPLVARLIQAVAVGVLLPLGLFALGRRVFGEAPALWAAGWGAVYGYFVYYSAVLMTEMLTIVALLGLLVLAIDLAERPTWRRWLAFGLLAGIAALLRQVTLLMVPVLGLWVLWRQRQPRALAGAALAAIVCLLLLLPVTWRNERAFGRFVLLNTNNGYAFFFANHPIHGTNFQGILSEEGPGYYDLIPRELLPLDEAALNDALQARAVDIILADPLRYGLLSLSRMEDYFKFWPAPESAPLSNLIRVLSFGLLLPFALYGLWLSRGSAQSVQLLWLFLGSYTLIHLLSWALIRYRLPVDAVLLVFAGLAAERLLGRRPHPRLAGLGTPAPRGGRGRNVEAVAAGLPVRLFRPRDLAGRPAELPLPQCLIDWWKAPNAHQSLPATLSIHCPLWGRGCRALRGGGGGVEPPNVRSISVRRRSALCHRLTQTLAGALASLALLAMAGHLAPTATTALAAPARLPAALPHRQIASETATPRLVLTDTPTPSRSGASTATPGGSATTATAPGGSATRSSGGPIATNAAGTSVPGTTATATRLGEPALPGEGTPGAGGENGGGAGTGPPDASAASMPGPAGLLRVPVDDRGIQDLWQRFGSPRATQPALARLTADRPGPWGWVAFYVLLVLAWLWVFWRVWRALGGLGDAA